MKNIYDVIRKPLITEKGTALAAIGNQYMMQVTLQASKTEIKEAVQRLFKVKVTGVRTMIMHGKMRRAGQFMAKRPNWKKAIVTLADGQKIDFFQTK